MESNFVPITQQQRHIVVMVYAKESRINQERLSAIKLYGRADK
jgi:hypothetical protein